MSAVAVARGRSRGAYRLLNDSVSGGGVHVERDGVDAACAEGCRLHVVSIIRERLAASEQVFSSKFCKGDGGHCSPLKLMCDGHHAVK